jgi:hypothetical protein
VISRWIRSERKSSKLRSKTETNWPKPKPDRSKRMDSQAIFLNKFEKVIVDFYLAQLQKGTDFLITEVLTLRQCDVLFVFNRWIKCYKKGCKFNFLLFRKGKMFNLTRGGRCRNIYLLPFPSDVKDTKSWRCRQTCINVHFLFISPQFHISSTVVSTLQYQLFTFPHPLSHSSTSVLVFTLP